MLRRRGLHAERARVDGVRRARWAARLPEPRVPAGARSARRVALLRRRGVGSRAMRWVPLAAACACLAGCFTAEWGTPCDGTCEPDVGGGWVPVLVGTAPECPDVAPYTSLAIASPPLTACGVAESEGGCPA